MRLIIEQNYEQLSKWAAEHVIERINSFNPTPDHKFVLGLPTGSSPIKDMYVLLRAVDVVEEVVGHERVVALGVLLRQTDILVHVESENVLERHTIVANSRFFDNDVKKVPTTALTVGVGTVMSAREVMILVNGHNKTRALQAAVEGPVTQMWTISVLQMHQHGIIVCDEAATDELKVSTYRYFKDIEKNNL